MWRNRRKLVAVLLVALGGAGAALAKEAVKVDTYQVFAANDSSASVLLVKPFTLDNTDFGKMKKKRQQEVVDNMSQIAPLAFKQVLIQKLSEMGGFSKVAEYEDGEVPESALVVEGEFTVLNPGSRGKRFWVGMGAGKSKTCVSGHVVTVAGEQRVTFEDCRSGTGMWSFAGGRTEGMMSNDIYLSAINLAEFIGAWVQGEVAVGDSKE
jgi:hypothetical protein